ncbi:hypothetical protein NE694_22565, partial [Phocaeicola vulgatus]|uniref:hypothetical protein n=1 Tax=Phocaeicola vulgatus TaxID=821 RepID=UPI00210BB607
YVPAINYDLDVDGCSQGAVTVKPDGYHCITDMLPEAMQMSKEVIEDAESGTYMLWAECDSLSYTICLILM